MMMNYRVLSFYYVPSDEYGTAGHTRAKVLIGKNDLRDVVYGTFLMDQARKAVTKPVSLQKAEAFRSKFMSILRGK